MPHINIFSYETREILFHGEYKDLKGCLEDAVSKEIDLSNADLSAGQLMNANLDGGVFANSCFDGANLSGANMSEAYLSGASFKGAELYNTCFAQSTMRGCDFVDASFGASDIAGANIAQSLFSTASCFMLDFALAEDMKGCCFQTGDGLLCQMSKPPTVVRGQWGYPIAVMDHHVKVGHHVKPLPWRVITNASHLQKNKAIAQ